MCNCETETGNENVRYRACEEWNTHPQLGRYRCYGILCESYLPGHGWRTEQSISDVTDSAEDAIALALLMQQGNLEPCHMHDVVEDFVNSI